MSDREQLRKVIEDTIADMVSDMLYYDRQDDEELPPEAINDAVEEGVITVEEMAKKFEEELRKYL